MQPEQRQLLEKALELSQTMLADAREGHWEGLPDLALQRRRWLEESLGSSVELAEAEWVREQLEAILGLDQQLMALATKGREESAQALQEMRQGGRAIKAYAAS